MYHLFYVCDNMFLVYISMDSSMLKEEHISIDI